ncbi:methionine--tRNA ligase subunit beta [Granulicella sp. dw_53]|uniref:methionine--tRNA ligase subunit beta n=1 Tax=Granulicella sp. dw_53 TaxID=2719792 RepID=UPI001BD283EC|nr:methionine--tRNA ligase subunit beta [Granulicella sp. dw_53]
MSETNKKFYLTTPIYYVNARPHIGHAYSTIAADVIARRHRLLGDDTFFLTGTDEHGQKVQRSAAAAGIPPQQFTDQVSDTFRNLWKRMGITNDDYIRTTEERHHRGVQTLWKHLEERGAIYLSSYTGQYSIGEEMFVDGPPGTIGPDGKPTETITEENYFFRLSDYQLPLIDLIESNQLQIQPETIRNEVLSFLRGDVNGILTELRDKVVLESPEIEASPIGKVLPISYDREKVVALAETDSRLSKSKTGEYYVPGALKDLSISRTSFTWGIPVPGNEKHVIYVWLDALANYMTAVGYGSEDPAEQAKFEKYWPADLHLVGKEITRFHCIYWPAFLLALNPKLQREPDTDKPAPTLTPAEHAEWATKWLPKAVVANGWLLFEESKMSKSRGNVVRTETILDAFGTLLPKPADLPGAVLSDEAWKHEQDLFASDVLRYFLLREIPFGQDGSFSFDALVQRYNSDLANGYGNLVSRTLAMVSSNFSGSIPEYDPPTEPESLPLSVIFEAKANGTDFFGALKDIWGFIGVVDGKISSDAPWKLAKSDLPEDRLKLAASLYHACESIRVITAYLYPILPYATAKVWQQLGLGDIEESARNGDLKNLEWGGLKPGTKLGPLSPIFPRADKGLIQIMTDAETNGAPSPTPSKFVDEKTTHTAPIVEDPTHPAAPPRTSSIGAPNPGVSVAGSHALTTERPGTPPHQEAPASGLFANAAAQSDIPDTPQIAIDDFVKIDLRVAQIIVAERIPKADKLLRLEVDLGYEKRQILSGIAEWYTPEDLIGRRIVIIANLAPRKMRGLESHGMLLAASHGENGKPILATFAEDIALGSRLR